MKNNNSMLKIISSKIANISLPVSILFAGIFIGTAIIVASLVTSLGNRYHCIPSTEHQRGCVFDSFTGIKYGSLYQVGIVSGPDIQKIYDYKSGKIIEREVKHVTEK